MMFSGGGYIEPILLAAATAVDIFAVSLGVRAAGIKFSFISSAAVIITGSVILWLSVLLSTFADSLLSIDGAVYISKAFLALMGIYTLFGDIIKVHKKPSKKHINCAEVMSDPPSADYDNSKSISVFEGAAMGLALSADSVCTGISAGIAGISPAYIFVFSLIFGLLAMLIGNLAGSALAKHEFHGFPAGRISGVILIILSIII